MKKVSSLSEFNDILKNNSKVVVDFYADWCGPCKRISPQLEELAKKFSDITFIKVNVESGEEISEEYHISSLPTFLFFHNGKLLDTNVVGASIDNLTKAVENLNLKH